MDYNMGNNQNHGVNAVNVLVRDIMILANGIADKSPENIDFAVVKQYLDLVKEEVNRVESGIYAKDNSIYYTAGEDISFEKESRTK